MSKKFKVEMMVHNDVLKEWQAFYNSCTEKKVGGGMLLGRQYRDVKPLYRVACVTTESDTAATPSGVKVTPYWDNSTVMTYLCTEDGINFLRSSWAEFREKWNAEHPKDSVFTCVARVVVTKCKDYAVWGEENALVMAQSGDGFKSVGEVLDDLADSDTD